MHDAKLLAEEFAEISPTSFLAHTIRKMEEKVFNLSTSKGESIVHRINVRINDKISHALCSLSHKNSTIFLPESKEQTPRALKELRLKFAHELGHIALRINEISDLKCDLKPYEKFNLEEEVESWKFAYELIRLKNIFHSGHKCDKFIYKDEKKIAASMEGIIRNSGHPQIEDMITSLKNSGINWE